MSSKTDKRTAGGKKAGGLMKKVRKPVAPPTRVADDERKYERAREREKLRRERKLK